MAALQTVGRRGLLRFETRRVATTIRNLALILAVLLGSSTAGIPQNWTSIDDDLLVQRDFSEIVLDGGAGTEVARIYVDPFRNVPSEEGQGLRQLVVDSIVKTLRIVDTKDAASYWLQILVHQDTDYAIRNSRRQPSRGSIVFSICKYPIKDINKDCETLSYYYFSKHDGRRNLRESVPDMA
jgi:hypothetical protein